MGAGSQYDYKPVKVEIAAAFSGTKYLTLPLHTDRHQFLVYVESGPLGADLPLEVAVPSLAEGAVPEPSSVPASEWAPPADLPSGLRSSIAFVLTGKYRYARVVTAGLGKNVTISVQPIEATSV